MHGTICKHGREYWQEPCILCELEGVDNLAPERYTEIIWKKFPIHNLELNALGLCGEAGEFANKIKKRTYTNIPDEDIIEELGDVLWHIAQCAHILGTDLSSLMKQSAIKCSKRLAQD